MPNTFPYTTTNVSDDLPVDWNEQLTAFTKRHMQSHLVTPSDATSRESDSTIAIPTLVVSGPVIQEELPWLQRFYETRALSLMQSFYQAEELVCARSPLYSINLQAAFDVDDRGVEMRYERHVDWAPTALLYVTTHRKGTGGELVVSNNPDARGDEIEADCVEIYPEKGSLVCFDARRHPHYVRPLLRPSSCDPGASLESPFRVVAVMLFCTKAGGSCPEASRPQQLDHHLGHSDGPAPKG